MASYFDEHPGGSNLTHRLRPANEDDSGLWLARMIVEGGWTDQLGLTFDQLFPDRPKAASPESIAKLERIRPSKMEDDGGQCLICLDTWENADDDEPLFKLPCDHHFHSKCILIWFKKVNSCPACRHELPSYDPLYEEYKRQQKRKEERKADIEELHDSMFS